MALRRRLHARRHSHGGMTMRLMTLLLAATVGASNAHAQGSLRTRVQKEGNLQLVETVQYEPASLKDLVRRSVLVTRVGKNTTYSLPTSNSEKLAYKSQTSARFRVFGGPQGVFAAQGDELTHVKSTRKLWEGESEERTSIGRSEFERLLQQAAGEVGK